MRLGIDGRKIPEAVKRGPVASFDHARDLGLSGLFFRTVLDISPTLDPGLLRATRARADELGMYMENGLAKVNPFALPETPEVRLLGNGDTLLAFRRMMEACADIGCTELWIALCNYKPAYVGKFSTDRFRTDVPWSEQLDATMRFLRQLAPIARDLGVHLNMETHEELSTFEVVRFVETIGPDVMGIVFDTANILQRGEHPAFAARRVAPYVRQTHIKDSILVGAPQGAWYQVRPCGQGIVDFATILPILAKARPETNLTLESYESHIDRPRKPVEMRIDFHDPDWDALHPDLGAEEKVAFKDLIVAGERRIRDNNEMDYAAWMKLEPGYDGAIALIKSSIAHIRNVCVAQGIALD